MKNFILPAIMALLCMFVSFPAFAEGVHNCVVVLVDGSGSMNESMVDPDNSKGASKKMEVAKRILLKVVPQVPEGTHVGLLVFDKSGVRWAYDLAPMNVTSFTAAVDGIRQDGGTPLGKSIKIGADRLMQEREVQLGRGTYKLLIVTDGEANDDVERNVTEVVARGIRVDTIGVAMKGGAQHSLAAKSHSYQGASNAVELETQMRQMIAAEAGGADETVDFSFNGDLSTEAAMVLIQALTQAPPNHPIGTEPPRPAKVQSGPSQGSSGSSGSQAQPASCNSSGSSGGLIALLLTTMVIALRCRHQRTVPVRIRR